jgi:hypothetical protein
MPVTVSSDIDVLIKSSDTLPREHLNFFEYRFLNTEVLRKQFTTSILKFSSNDNNFCVSALNNKQLAGFMICEHDAFASEIFGFNVCKILHFAVLKKEPSEFGQITDAILNSLYAKAEEYEIKYITFSLNQNIFNSQKVFNHLLSRHFYYINTLLTFKIEKEEFKNLYLPENPNSDIVIRKAENNDRDALYEIAAKSYVLDRFHLDSNLDRKKCDLFQAVSTENSLLKGYADINFIAEYKGNIAGYYSGKRYHDDDLNITIGNAIISAVDENARGLGVFSSLNTYLLNWFYKNTDLAEMGTYINNIHVHKVWTKNRLSVIRGSHQLAWYKN